MHKQTSYTKRKYNSIIKMGLMTSTIVLEEMHKILFSSREKTVVDKI